MSNNIYQGQLPPQLYLALELSDNEDTDEIYFYAPAKVVRDMRVGYTNIFTTPSGQINIWIGGIETRFGPLLDASWYDIDANLFSGLSRTDARKYFGVAKDREFVLVSGEIMYREERP
jgi:hypothetical protein